MALSADPWIEKYSIVEPERLHALGMITLYWNHCQRNLFYLFCETFNLHPRIGWIIAHDMGDVALCARIQAQLKFFEKTSHPETANLLLNATKVYDACRQNRNTLTHFLVEQNPDRSFSFIRTKGIVYNPKEFPSSLTDLRRVSNEVQALGMYLWELHESIKSFGTSAPKALPPQLAVPELLWKPPLQTHPARS